MNLKIWTASQTWAIVPEILSLALAESGRHNQASPRVKLPRVEGQVAIIPIYGMITQRGSPMSDMFGGTSTQAFEGAFSRAVASDRISAVVLDVDSPGGTTSGVEMAADRVFAARGTKPIVAVANSQAASAAYWIASSADTFAAAPGASVGSIGVFRAHEDHSEALRQAGIKMTLLGMPEFKTEGNPAEPLSDEGKAYHMEQVHHTFRVFNSAVARNRALTVAQTRDKFCKGRMCHSDDAAQLGMVDRVASLPKLLSELGVGRGRTSAVEAADAQLTAELCQAWEMGEVSERPRFSIDKARRRLRIDELSRAI